MDRVSFPTETWNPPQLGESRFAESTSGCADLNPSTSLVPSEADFEAIESAVMETERGRWFLAEFARRRRAEESARVLSAIDRLEARSARAEVERVRQRIESERAAEILRQLGEVLKDLRPLADARVRTRALASREGTANRADRVKASGLESRFAKLVELDRQDLEDDCKLFG